MFELLAPSPETPHTELPVLIAGADQSDALPGLNILATLIDSSDLKARDCRGEEDQEDSVDGANHVSSLD